jgi:hypothetical protein
MPAVTELYFFRGRNRKLILTQYSNMIDCGPVKGSLRTCVYPKTYPFILLVTFLVWDVFTERERVSQALLSLTSANLHLG